MAPKIQGMRGERGPHAAETDLNCSMTPEGQHVCLFECCIQNVHVSLRHFNVRRCFSTNRSSESGQEVKTVGVCKKLGIGGSLLMCHMI